MLFMREVTKVAEIESEVELVQYAQLFRVPTSLDAKELLRLAMADGNAQKVKKNKKKIKTYLYDNTQRANFRGKPLFQYENFGGKPLFNVRILGVSPFLRRRNNS